MIPNVTRGRRVHRLLNYLYGPGRHAEHTDQHTIAGFDPPDELQPDRRPDGSLDTARLARLLEAPLWAVPGGRGWHRQPVWHCSRSAAPTDRRLSDAEWARIAEDVMHRTGIAVRGDPNGCRWIAMRHADNGIHLVATLAHADGTRPRLSYDFRRVHDACAAAERRQGLRIVGHGGKPSTPAGPACPNRRGTPCAAGSRPPPPPRPTSTSSPPDSAAKGYWSGCTAPPPSPARSPATRSACPATATARAGRSGSAARSWPRTCPYPNSSTAGAAHHRPRSRAGWPPPPGTRLNTPAISTPSLPGCALPAFRSGRGSRLSIRDRSPATRWPTPI